MSKEEEAKLLTITAFILGYILIDTLSSTEQNALGNWLMLVSQTLCTNGSYTFNKEWKGHIGGDHVDVRNMFDKFKDSVDRLNEMIR